MLYRDKQGRFVPSLVNRVKTYLKDLPWELFEIKDGLIRINGSVCPLVQKTGLPTRYTDKAADDLHTTYMQVVRLVWDAADNRYPSTIEATNLREWMIQQIHGAKHGAKRA